MCSCRVSGRLRWGRLVNDDDSSGDYNATTHYDTTTHHDTAADYNSTTPEHGIRRRRHHLQE